MDIHIHLNGLEKAIDLLLSNNQKLNQMADELKTLTDQVTKNNDVVESAITLIQGIKTALDAAIAANNPAALQALSDSLGAEDQKLADAVAANTPAA